MTTRLRRIDDYRWEIPIDYKPGMRVPGIIYANEAMIREIEKDKSFEQVANTACLPGIVRAATAMPDMHFGYGFPIGGVVATDAREGVISPGGVGFDINCGVRLVSTLLRRDEIIPKMHSLVNTLYDTVPTGVGSEGLMKLTPAEERGIMIKGARWMVERGIGKGEDLAHTEAGGCLEGADPDKVSKHACERGKKQAGTVGSGNHFVEVQYVDKIYHEKAAERLGISEGQVTVMIHSGSRGFGHQVCTDYLQVMNRAMHRYKIQLPDRQLACPLLQSPRLFVMAIHPPSL